VSKLKEENMVEPGIIRRVAAYAVPMLAFALATCCTAAGEPDRCIVGANAIGCVDPLIVDKITAGVDDPFALRDEIKNAIDAGTCSVFAYGERVFTTSSDADGRSAVRRPDDTASYWMPSSWSRPASECRRNASQESLGKRVGVPTPAPYTPRTPAPRAVARDHPAARSAACDFKPVMTDAEIAACREANH
jgi:hypothetical protein